MQKYTDLVLGLNGQTLVPVVGASVTVLNYPSGATATIYSDNGVTQAANPLTTDPNGRFSFYAANGRYSLQVTYQTVTYSIQDIPLLDDPANGQTVVVTGGSIDNTPIGSTTPSTGAFTNLSASGAVTFKSGTIDNVPIGSTTPSSGSFTTLSASGTVSGAGITSLFASPPAIGGTAAAAGHFTTLQSTGLFSPSSTNGIAGTTTNDNANAGSWGEYVTASFASVALTSGVNNNPTSISLTAGDWDIDGGVVITASTNNMTNITGGITTTAGSLPAPGYYWNVQQSTGFLAYSAALPHQRLSLTATTTVYVILNVTFASGTAATSGIIRARRVR